MSFKSRLTHRLALQTVLLCLGLSFGTTPSWADVTIASVTSPDKTLHVEVQLASDGRLAYAVNRRGKSVIAPSRLGFLLTNAAQLDAGFSLDSQSTTLHDDTWEQPWGERRFVRNHYQELRLQLAQKNRHIAIVFRVFNDGIGFRYEFPQQAELADIHISDELTEFIVAQPATAWWQPAGEVWALEYPIKKSPLAEVGMANTPLTIRTTDGTHIALHEAALIDYASMWVRKVDGQKLRAHLTPSATGPAVKKQGAFNTPWRTLQIADNAAGLYMSDLILNLNEANKLGDVSWVHPSKFIGVWWEMHLGKSSWSSGAKHGATTENVKRHIDFAAKHGFQGVLVEGWNQGWDGNWVGSESDFSFTLAYPDFDLPGLTAYAKEKGVRLIGHHETGGHIAHYEAQMDAGYQLYAGLGIDTIKSGYVTDAGTAVFPDADGRVHLGYTDSQEGTRHYLKAITEAARYHLSIDTHEPIKDTGLRRTYPNWLSREGARGMEYNAWGNPINSVDHEANLVFTRMLSGPMDFTPGILSLEGVQGRPIHSTLAKQLADFIVIYSPVVMAADLIENYEKYPGPFQFIKDVPCDWADTRVIHGSVGEYATIARKDRHSGDWYVGSITDGNARVLDLPLDFLESGKRYIAEIYRDGDKADYRNAHRHDLVIEKKFVTAKDHLRLHLAKGGGQAIRFKQSGG